MVVSARRATFRTRGAHAISCQIPVRFVGFRTRLCGMAALHPNRFVLGFHVIVSGGTRIQMDVIRVGAVWRREGLVDSEMQHLSEGLRR